MKDCTDIDELWEKYRNCSQLATRGDRQAAAIELGRLLSVTTDASLLAHVQNDLGVLAGLEGRIADADKSFVAAMNVDPNWSVPQENRRHLASRVAPPGKPTRVAIISLLFNWPSTGGGTVHTAETGKFLAQAGYDVRHFYAQLAGWGVGNVTEPLLAPSEALQFTTAEWSVHGIQSRFRAALHRFKPDWVIVTDSWNSKPILAESARDFRFFLRLAAQECLCPLNNVRLLLDRGRFRSCPKHQLATPGECSQCVSENGNCSGGLHRAERELVNYGTPEYDRTLRWAFTNAEAVLVVNPLIEAMVSPHARKVCVIPSGFDIERFPKRRTAPMANPRNRVQVLFAGLIHEPMKGFNVLREACSQLWNERQDFELVVTADPPGQVDAFTRFVGWQSQSTLPSLMCDADILVAPTIAEEALGRTAVEAMGAGRPVIASRIGGLQFTVTDGATGLLFDAGSSSDLARKIATLLDQPELRERMGVAGRQRFEESFTWDSIVKSHYLPLFGPPTRGIDSGKPSLSSTSQRNVSMTHGAGVTSLGQACPVTLGCVLAIQDRPVAILERTLQTYAFQTFEAADRVLVDYGSRAELTLEYQRLCDRYAWRFVRVETSDSEWSLSTAYNAAVSVLNPEVNVVFKSDVDVLVGADVLETAASLAINQMCIFTCQTTTKGSNYPSCFPNHQALAEWAQHNSGLVAMDGEGIHAYPRRWFDQIGGFDLEFGTTWGFEDSDLRLRASWSIGVVRPAGQLLIHQWHPSIPPSEAILKNRRYYDATKGRRQLTRNGGQLLPVSVKCREAAPAGRTQIPVRSKEPGGRRKTRVAVATRSLVPELFQLSDEFLFVDRKAQIDDYIFERYQVVGTDACGYFRKLTELEADWIINVDEDAFVLDVRELSEMIRFMDRCGYAACGMPDGGVVSIRQHNPVACNAFLNIFDMRRVRPIWSDWPRAKQCSFRPQFEAMVPDCARRTPAIFDTFEPYYGLFFSLIEQHQSILYLDAREWRDGISTLLLAPSGVPLALHSWYAREWATDLKIRERITQLAMDAHLYRTRLAELHPARPTVSSRNSLIDEICGVTPSKSSAQAGFSQFQS